MAIFWKKRVDRDTVVTPIGRDEYLYESGGRQLKFNAEAQKGEPQRLIYASSIGTWLPPHSQDPILVGQRQEIFAKIVIFFQSNGYSSAIVGE